jgi:hypothetical protein
MKFPTVILCSTLLFVAVIQTVFSQQAAHIQTTSTGVHIRLRGLSAVLKPANEPNTSSAWITNSRYAVLPSDQRAPALQMLRISIAIPQSGEITPQLYGFRTRKVGHSVIARSSEFAGNSQPSQIFFSNFSIKPSVVLRRVGNKRGVEIADIEIQPFEYSSSAGELSILDSAEIDIPFGVSLPTTSGELFPSERGSFSDVANSSQIPALRRIKLREDAKAPRPLNSLDSLNTWYNPQTTYLRIATTTDGIARLQAQDILAVVPEWTGLPINGLHLFYKGKEYPIGVKSANSTMKTGDEYFFAGRRAIGDSTWQNCITPEAVFYLYYDGTFAGKRFGQFPVVTQPTAEIQSVTINKHIEEDHIHYWGDDDPIVEGLTQYDTEILLNEGFYWANLNNSIFEYNKVFSYNVMVAPSDLNGDLLQTKIFYHTSTKNSFSEPNYSIITGINGTEKSRRTASGILNGISEFSMPSSNFLGGVNLLTVKSDTVSNDISGRVRLADMFIDYFTIFGKVKPFAEAGKADFVIEEVMQPSRVNIRGVRSSQIVIMDTLKSLFFIKTGTSGTTVRAGASGGQSPRISIVINDSIIAATDSSGLYVAIADAPAFTNIRSRRFDQNGGGLRGFIDAAPTGSIIAAASNLTSISQEIKQVFSALGSQEINQFQVGNSWAAAFLKGTIAATREKRGAISCLAEFVPHSRGNSFQTDLELEAGNSYALQVADILSAETATVRRELPTNLHDTTQRYDAIIITHSNFKEAADRLAKHRASQGWKTTVVRVEDIYKEFYGGEKSPHAIKRFLKYAYNYWQKPTPAYLIMFGDASWDPRKFQYNSVETDYLPSYGQPVSDFWFTLLDGNDLIPEMTVGRLPVRSLAEAHGVVNKLIEYDSLPAAPWKKRYLFLSGGSGSEGKTFYNKFYEIADYVVFPPVCVDTTRIRGDLGVDYAKPTTIRSAINEGVLWLTFTGHSAPTIFDLDGWAVEDLNNRGRYNLLSTYSCNSGAFATPYGIARNESYVITPNKGSIAAFGSTFIGVVDNDALLQFGLHKNMAEDTVRLVGDMLNKTKRGWEVYPNLLMQYSLIGDPLTRIALDNKPDLYSQQQEVIITSLTGETTITEIDSAVTAMFTVRNAGISTDREIPLLLIHRFPNGIDSTTMTLGDVCNRETMSTLLTVKNRHGTHTFTISIDPNATLNESKRSNNITTISFEVFSAGLATLDPQLFWDIDAQKPAFRLVQPQPIDQAEYEFILTSASGDTIAHLIENKPTSELNLHEVFIEWMPKILLESGKSYILSARIKNRSTDKISTWLRIPFHAVTAQKEYTADWKQQTAQEILSSRFHDIIQDNQSESTFHLNTYSVPVSVVANNGNSYAKLKIGESEPIGFNIYTRFNLVHLTPRDTNYKYFDFETFFDKGRNGTAADVVRYLRDSVAWGDVIMLAPAGAAFNTFMLSYPPDSVGSMKSLTEVLMKQYGASLIDSVYLRTHYPDGRPIDPVFFNSTGYALIARKDSLPHAVKEIYGYWEDTVTLEDTIQFYSYSGEITSPLIGPAAEWDSLYITASIPSLAAIKVEVYGKSSSSSPEQLLKSDSVTAISLHNILAKDFPYIQIRTILERSDYKIEPTVSGFECFYKPTVEYALLPSKTYISNDSILRGDTSAFNGAVMNIAKRGLPEFSDATTTIRPDRGNGTSFSYFHSLPKLLSGEILEFTDTIPSKELALTSRVQAEIDNKNDLHELYRFNNKLSSFLHLREDTIKPRIEFRVDGIVVKNNDFVAPEPLFEIIIHDNSQLVIDSAKIRVRVNRFIQPDTSSLNPKFERIRGQGDIRARLSFITKRLEEENIIQITVEDASANKDTLKIRLYVAKNASIQNLLTIPTPTDQVTTLTFDYIGQNQGSPATLDIFNLSGQSVRSLTTNVRIGSNSLTWDGYDNLGNRVAPGVYVYRLNVQAAIYSDPIFGKIMIAR